MESNVSTCGGHCKKPELLELLSQGHEPSESYFQCEACFQAFCDFEESFVSVLQSDVHEFSNTPFSEEWDLSKASATESLPQLPLPSSLWNYTVQGLKAPERKNSLVVRLVEHGISVAKGLLDPLFWTETESFLPALRSAVDHSHLETNSVVFQERTEGGMTFYYQIVKEKADEIYLSVKIGSQNLYDRVVLKKEGRFILSQRMEEEGTASFSGLKEGHYSVEFLGEKLSKSFDLVLLLG